MISPAGTGSPGLVSSTSASSVSSSSVSSATSGNTCGAGTKDRVRVIAGRAFGNAFSAFAFAGSFSGPAFSVGSGSAFGVEGVEGTAAGASSFSGFGAAFNATDLVLVTGGRGSAFGVSSVFDAGATHAFLAFASSTAVAKIALTHPKPIPSLAAIPSACGSRLTPPFAVSFAQPIIRLRLSSAAGSLTKSSLTVLPPDDIVNGLPAIQSDTERVSGQPIRSRGSSDRPLYLHQPVKRGRFIRYRIH